MASEVDETVHRRNSKCITYRRWDMKEERVVYSRSESFSMVSEVITFVKLSSHSHYHSFIKVVWNKPKAFADYCNE